MQPLCVLSCVTICRLLSLHVRLLIVRSWINDFSLLTGSRIVSRTLIKRSAQSYAQCEVQRSYRIVGHGGSFLNFICALSKLGFSYLLLVVYVAAMQHRVWVWTRA